MMLQNETIKVKFLKGFGENMKKIRKEKKLTQLELADRINGDEKKIGRIERGEYDFKISSALILAKALDVPVCDLLKINKIEYFQENIWKQLLTDIKN